MWLPEIKLRSSDLVADALLPTEPSCQPHILYWFCSLAYIGKSFIVASSNIYVPLPFILFHSASFYQLLFFGCVNSFGIIQLKKGWWQQYLHYSRVPFHLFKAHSQGQQKRHADSIINIWYSLRVYFSIIFSKTLFKWWSWDILEIIIISSLSEVQIFNWYLVFYLQAIPALVKLERGNLIKSQDNQLKLGYWCNFKACLLTENKWIKFCLVIRSRLASLDVVLSSCETRGFHSRSKCQKDLGDLCVCVGGGLFQFPETQLCPACLSVMACISNDASTRLPPLWCHSCPHSYPVLKMEPGYLNKLGRHSATELCPLPYFILFYIWARDSN